MIAISMRIMDMHYPGGKIERRDALAHDWHLFIRKALPGRYLLPVPNIGRHAVDMLQSLPISGLILSGGDDWGVHPERDETEKFLFEHAFQNNWPILGICRGAQVINRLLGGFEQPGFGKTHTGTRHGIQILENPFLEASLEVNSFHSRAILPQNLGKDLQIMAQAPDNSVEAFFLPDKNIAGILWHPERENKTNSNDIRMLNKLFGRKGK